MTQLRLSDQLVGTILGAALRARTLALQRARLLQIPGAYVPPVHYLGDIIPFTTRTQEAYEYRAEVTEHAVEAGPRRPVTIFSDHVILRPLRLYVEFEVSNYDGLGSKAQLAKHSLEVAIELWKARQLVDLVTTHQILKNMICLELSPINEAPVWGKLGFRSTWQQVQLVTLETQRFTGGTVYGDPVAGVPQAPEGTTEPGGPATGRSVNPASPPKIISPQITSTPFQGKGGQFKGYGNTVGW